MKNLLFIFIISLSLKAESIHNSKCVQNFFGNFHNSTSNATISIHYSDGTSLSVPYSFDVINSLSLNDGKYIYSTIGSIFQRCTYTSSNLTLENEAFLSSLVGILIGFTILFFSIFLTIKIGAKK